jgi:hypothetical protein
MMLFRSVSFIVFSHRCVRASHNLEVFRPYTYNGTAAIYCDADQSVLRKLRHLTSLAGDVEACILDSHQLDGLADGELIGHVVDQKS